MVRNELRYWGNAMIIIGNYSIMQYAPKNKLVICLPQTERSSTNTITPVESRRYKLTNEELTKLLLYAMSMYKDGAEWTK